jgi:hypothetical protein
MKNIKSFNELLINEKDEKWIKDAIKKPGALRKSLKKEKGEKITKSEIDEEISKLKKKDKDKEKPGLQLSPKDRTKYKRLILAKNLRRFNESEESNNYMFFYNLEAMKKMIDNLSKMDQNRIDKLLDEHDWASDHISVAAENLEHVYNFFTNKEK